MIRILFLLVTAFTVYSCSKEETTITGNWLEMKVTDSRGLPVQNAEIHLYRDIVEWANYVNPIAGPYYSGSNGVALIKGLDRGIYYFNV
jgi:predicted protein tyrosine phosphatase